MTTRASTARGQDKQQFQGRVRKWRRQWDLAGDTAKYKLLKWVSTEERTEDRSSPRYPGLLPVIKVSSPQQRFVTLPQAALSNDQKQARTHYASSDAKPDAIELQSTTPANGYQNASKCANDDSSQHNASLSSAAVVNGLSSHLLPVTEPPSLGIKLLGDTLGSAVQDLEGSSLEPNNSVSAPAHVRSDVSIVG